MSDSPARKTALELEKIQKFLDDNKQIIEQAKANESAGQTEKNEKLLKVIFSCVQNKCGLLTCVVHRGSGKTSSLCLNRSLI